jgi:nitrite reductase/ring-hydroxylating ferredoxin subunit
MSDTINSDTNISGRRQQDTPETTDRQREHQQVGDRAVAGFQNHAAATPRPEERGGYVHVSALRELTPDEGTVVQVDGQPILLILHQGRVFAVANRCPHMGFPLQKGSVKDGILTCHWHHARFDLACGGTFDLWADDARSYPVEVRGQGEAAEVWVDPVPRDRDQIAYYSGRLHDGLKYNLRLHIAKAVIGLFSVGASPEVALRVGAEYGTLYSSNGWGPGLTILTAMANILPHLRAEDQPRALYQGLMRVASECAGRPPRFPLEPLPRMETEAAALKRWFREFVERRNQDGAERSLRTAIEAGLPPTEVADMLFAACTDHLYRGLGHPLDFTNKAFELLDQIGWERAGDVLTSLVGPIVSGARLEENASWRHPIDLAELLWAAYAQLPEALAAGRDMQETWQGAEALVATLLGEDPAATIDALNAALRSGATPHELAATVTYAAARRIVHFRTSNEFSDWDTTLHTFTYANAVQQAIRRVPTVDLMRGVYDAAISIYLDRFLNMPPAPLPPATGHPADPEELLPLLDRQQQVQEAGILVSDVLGGAGADEAGLLAAIGQALLREDADFHTFQCVEAAFRQYRDRRGTEAGRHVLIAAARYLAAHAPTVRAVGQTYQIALRLHRGEELYQE